MTKVKMQVNYQPTARVSIDCSVGGRTKQSFKNECDINNIMSKFEKSGLLDHVNHHKGDYGDFVGYDDYHSCVNQVLDAQEAFASIPSKIRALFGNDPASFMDFAQNPDNMTEMVKMGLAHGPSTGATLPHTAPPPNPAPNEPPALDPAPTVPTTPV